MYTCTTYHFAFAFSPNCTLLAILSGMFPIFYHPPPLCTTTATNPSSPRYHHRHLHTLIRLLTVPPPPPPPFYAYHYSQLHSRTIPCLARALFPTILLSVSIFLSCSYLSSTSPFFSSLFCFFACSAAATCILNAFVHSVKS